MKTLLMILAGCACFVTQIAASVVTGRVFDENGEPVSYASVYCAGNPQNGVITDADGIFSMENLSADDMLVVSFIGYETCNIPGGSLPDGGDTLDVVLKEQPILLEETLVTKTKPAKKMTRRQKKSLLEDVRTQMERDFPDEYVRYGIASDYAIHNGGQIVAFEELLGDLVEMPIMKKSGKKDSIQLRGEYCKRYRDSRAEENLEEIELNTKKKQRRQLAQRADSSVMIHRTMWGSGIKWFFDELAEHPGRWELVERGDVSVLTYTDKKNFLGIVKYELTMNYVIDPYSYSVKKLSQELYAYANIPFGYKLDEDMLAVFNMLNITGEEVEKFRLKKVDGNIRRNILYDRDDRRTYVSEKNVVFDIKLEDRKGRGFALHNTALVNVLSREAGARPFTIEELNQNFPTVEIDAAEAR